MPTASDIKPTHKVVQNYYDTLASYSGQHVAHESAVRSAFQNLLAETAKLHGWILIPELGADVAGRRVRPDGTVRDQNSLPRGYWEAKDTDDDLDVEIKKKTKRGYPLTNTIFEDTRTAVLFQNQREVVRVSLDDRQKLCDLLNRFYSYAEPDIESFEHAVEAFKDRVPELGHGLAEKIKQAHDENPRFQQAFDLFFQLCQTAINPNIRRDAVDEMVVQHLLTERLIRTIFKDSDFTRRNVVAAEIERVIDALVSRSFNREQFLRSLDPFYVAIENAARRLEEFQDKQQLLNTVYERFFQGYSVKVADTHGIIYTPQPIVDFMCASVAEVLETEFGLSLGSPGVVILDPCTGTGNFIVNLLGRIAAKSKRDLPRMYRTQLFANEVMLLPYYVAALNIEHAYYELTGQYEPFEGLCFVDTLDLSERVQREFSFMTEENTARVKRQNDAPITVVIGNPPYNMLQQNENDDNRNRKYEVVDQRIAATFVKDSTATLRMQLYDAYVRFFRWAIDRLQGRDGIICFVSNNSFVDQRTFDGMRKHLLADFTRIYHVDLHGNVRLNPKLSGTTHNVFGIRVGVGITLAVRKGRSRQHKCRYHRVPEDWRKEEKLSWLTERETVRGVDWQSLKPDATNRWFVPEHALEFASFESIGGKSTKGTSHPAGSIFSVHSSGIKTNADAYVYDFHRSKLIARAAEMVESFNGELDRWKRRGQPKELAGVLKVDERVHKWIRNTKRTLLRGQYVNFAESSIRIALYRPFTKRAYYFERAFNEDTYQMPRIFPTETSEHENRLIVVSDIASRANQFTALIADRIPDLHLCASVDAHQCFPFYVYHESGENRRENVTDWALGRFREHYRDASITKWDIFYYVYGLLHHPGYRERFSDNLKRELPRIPFAPAALSETRSKSAKGVAKLRSKGTTQSSGFWAFADAGRQLAELHLNYEQLEPFPLQFVESPEVPLSYRVDEKMRLSRDRSAVHVNESLTLAGIPAETFDYRLGNRSALEWVIEQYHVATDKRSGIHSDPNRADDEQYIVRLIGQIVRVSTDTVRIIAKLPESFS